MLRRACSLGELVRHAEAICDAHSYISQIVLFGHVCTSRYVRDLDERDDFAKDL